MDTESDESGEETAHRDEKTQNNERGNASSDASQSIHVQSNVNQLIEQYRNSQRNACDFVKRYCGHCNVATDIKEANFVGE